MAAPMKVQLFGHSFVSKFISEEPGLRFDMGLYGSPLIQYTGFPGASIPSLRKKLEFVEDFSPNLMILMIGTNDIYRRSCSLDSIMEGICDIVECCVRRLGVSTVIVCPVLHRCTPSIRTRYPVDIPLYNARVDELNILLSDALKTRFPNEACLWRIKGFWTPESKARNFSVDGCHLSKDGQFKLLSNLRAAIVSAFRATMK